MFVTQTGGLEAERRSYLLRRQWPCQERLPQHRRESAWPPDAASRCWGAHHLSGQPGDLLPTAPPQPVPLGSCKSTFASYLWPPLCPPCPLPRDFTWGPGDSRTLCPPGPGGTQLPGPDWLDPRHSRPPLRSGTLGTGAVGSSRCEPSVSLSTDTLSRVFQRPFCPQPGAARSAAAGARSLCSQEQGKGAPTGTASIPSRQPGGRPAPCQTVTTYSAATAVEFAWSRERVIK